jgi:hypothetical protein
LDPLSIRAILDEISQAWRDSLADDPDLRHEEGGYIMLEADLSYAVARWPRGEQSRIRPPAMDADSCYNGRPVMASFHTHPNPPIDEAGREWEQGPSASDRRWHERRNLRGYVVSQLQVYEISGRGRVSIVGRRDEVLL